MYVYAGTEEPRLMGTRGVVEERTRRMSEDVCVALLSFPLYTNAFRRETHIPFVKKLIAKNTFHQRQYKDPVIEVAKPRGNL